MTEPTTTHNHLTTADLIEYIESDEFEFELAHVDQTTINKHKRTNNQFTIQPDEYIGQCRITEDKIPTSENWQELYPECYDKLRQKNNWEEPGVITTETQTTHTDFWYRHNFFEHYSDIQLDRLYLMRTYSTTITQVSALQYIPVIDQNNSDVFHVYKRHIHDYIAPTTTLTHSAARFFIRFEQYSDQDECGLIINDIEDAGQETIEFEIYAHAFCTSITMDQAIQSIGIYLGLLNPTPELIQELTIEIPDDEPTLETMDILSQIPNNPQPTTKKRLVGIE